MLHMQSCPITDFLIKGPLPLHFQNIWNESSFHRQQEHHQQKIRKQEGRRNAKKIRIFQNPHPNYAADHYHEMISWEVDGQYEPSFTKSTMDDKIRSFADTPLELHIHAHTITIEHTIRDTTKVFTKTTSAKKMWWDDAFNSCQ